MTHLRQGSGGRGPHRPGSGGHGPHRPGSGGHVAALLSFPDSDDKANRRARAALGMSAGSVDGYVQLVDRLCLSFPVRQMCEESGDWKRRLHLWADGANRLLFEIARRPVQLRADTLLLDRLLKLKGLVSEAEAECLSDMRSPRGDAPADCLGMARAVNDAMCARLESSAPGARRAPAATLTPELLSAVAAPAEGMPRPGGAGYLSGRGIVSDNLVLRGDRVASDLRVSADLSAGAGVAGSEVAPLPGREPATASSNHSVLLRLLHGQKLRRFWALVTEKAKRGFSLGRGMCS